MKRTKHILSAMLLMALPLTATVYAEPVEAKTTLSQKQAIEILEGYWVDVSGRGVLTFKDGQVTYIESTRRDTPQTFSVSVDGNHLAFTPPVETPRSRPISAQIDWQAKNLSFNHGPYEFIPAPAINPADLDGFWYEEADNLGARVVRSLQYKNNATSYDYHWWRINPGYGTFTRGVDYDVRLQMLDGFIFTDPVARASYVHYAIRIEGDTIHYVDQNGAHWTETRVDSLKNYEPPKGFKELSGVMTRR